MDIINASTSRFITPSALANAWTTFCTDRTGPAIP
jgi:hypothetical protein